MSSGAVSINSGTLTSGNGADLILIQNNTGTAMTIGSQVTGSIGLTKFGRGTVILSNSSNSYNGATTVNAGTLQLGNNNVLPSTSAVAIGVAGTLDMQGNTDAVTSLAFGDFGGTLKMAANQTGSAQLAASGTAALGSGQTLDLTGMGTSQGLYKLVSAGTLTGAFGSVTGLNSAYVLRNGTLTPNELDAQHLADQSLAAASPVVNIISNQPLTVTGTLTNTAPSGSTSSGRCPDQHWRAGGRQSHHRQPAGPRHPLRGRHDRQRRLGRARQNLDRAEHGSKRDHDRRQHDRHGQRL